MDEAKFDSWLEVYGRAWEDRDPAAVAELFSENATYRETPFDEAARGREAIFEYWARATAEHEGVRFGHEVLMVNRDLGIARWWVALKNIRSGAPVELDGIFVVCMDANGRCEEFREWWHFRELSSEA